MLDSTEFGYGGFTFNWGDHVCAFFDDHMQQMEVLAPFVSVGIQLGQRCAWIAPEPSCNALRRALAEMGGDLATLEASGQLLIMPDPEFYLHEGVFEPDRTMDLVRALLGDSQRQGYPAMRMCNDVSWLGGGRVDAELWEEFELTLTEAITNLPLCLVCAYDRRQVSGSILVAAIRTHPVMVVGTNFRANPFYEPGPAGFGGVREVI